MTAMEPLSMRTRRIYLYVSVVLFSLMLPAVILYADGWRYKRGYGFVRTGGIYLSVPYPDASISINGAVVGKSGFLNRSLFVNDLAPSAYVIHVEREGYRPWDRILVVEEQLVTDARVHLIPSSIPVRRVIAATTSASVATTTRSVPRQILRTYEEAFAATSTASTTVPVDQLANLGLFVVDGRLLIRWLSKDAFPISALCERPTACVQEIVLERRGVTDAFFFGGGIVYVKDNKVYFSEIDVRQVPVHAVLFEGTNVAAQIVDDRLIVQSEKGFWDIEL